MSRFTGRRVASVLAGAGALVLIVAVPAQAASYFRGYEGSDYAGVGADRRWVEVCDMEKDGNGVYATFIVRGSTGGNTVGDGNGSAAGCGNRTFSGDVLGFSICEDQPVGNSSCRTYTL
ncbi:hypothetical protein FXF50_08985 [Micromonospora sp. AP08]|uniref:hypothetical protein n=1 Tax=Micromonospora sp. AP08 TaxID=2604467 RepID=UPI0011D5B4AE|nr:hypothetical protein [Micromonospora sp. AP08]TYB38544.1 hypothetical protein FXF50_08985 [Micromonospora sp. AP08]